MRRVTDPRLVYAIWSNPSIHPFVTDDFSQFFPLPELAANPAVVCLMPEDDSAYFLFVQHRPLIWEVHAAVLRDARHRSVEMGKAAAQWMRRNANARQIWSLVPKGNYTAAALDRAIGFKKVGVIPRSNPKDGQLRDMTLYVLEV